MIIATSLSSQPHLISIPSLSPHCMLYWSLFLLLLIPLVPFLQPGFIAMASLSTIPESSNGHIEIIDDEETQVVPETQFDDDYGDDLDFDDDKENHDRPTTRGRDSMTPGTKKVFEASRPLSSHGTALAASDLTFQLVRPKSSGEDSVAESFSYASHVLPKMNFQHGKRQESPPREAQKLQENGEYREGELLHFFAFSSLMTK